MLDANLSFGGEAVLMQNGMAPVDVSVAYA